MSLTSCFKYVIELPESTLTELLRSVISQADTADLPLTYEDDGIPIDGYTARISARLVDSDDRPSAFDLTTTDLEAVLHLHMDAEVTIEDVDGIEPIVYQVDFNLPGTIARNDAAVPVQIEYQVGAIDTADLEMVVTGGDLIFSGALFKPYIDQMYTNNADLQHDIIPNVDTTAFCFGVVTAEVFLYNNPTDGEISVDIPSQGTLRCNFPGRVILWDISATEVENFTITLSVDIDYEVQPDAGGGRELVVKTSEVQTSDVSVSYGPEAPSGACQGGMTTKIQEEVVAKLVAIADIREPVPSDADLEDRFAPVLVEYATDLTIPLFPLDPTASTIAIDTAVPTTVGGAVLALQVEDEPTAPCEGPDDFTQGSAVAIAMGALEAQRRVDAAAASMDGQEIDASEYNGDYDVTVNRPTVTLEDAGEHDVAEGHFWVTGTVTVHVGGCVGDVGADYFGPLMLDVSVNADQTIEFQLRPGTFGGDADVKDKKDEFDPAIVASFIAGWDFDFPTIPTVFEGVGTLTLNIDTAEISRGGITLLGGVQIQLLQMLQLYSIGPFVQFWDFEGAGGG